MAKVVVVDSGESPKRRIRWWLWLSIIIFILLLAVGGFVVWALTPVSEALPEAIMALESDEQITVSTRTWIAFVPHDTPPTTGFIFYGGARVPAEAYAPLARAIAAEGYLAVIVYPTLNLAILNSNVAEPVLQHFSAIEHWVVAGHSLGGTAAASFASSHPEQVDGLVLLASFPGNDSLKDSQIPVLSIYASNDNLTPIERIEASKEDLPLNQRFVKIEGGNHAQFGYYGEQGGDGEASISREEQLSQSVAAILAFLQGIELSVR